MEAISVSLLGQVTNYLSTLDSRQMTAMVCDGCYDLYGFVPAMWPAENFMKKEGICSFCFTDHPVSSPYLNYFLKQDHVRDDQDQSCCRETERLIQDWLLPVGYLQQRREDVRLGEGELWTWIQYGVTMRRAIPAADLSDENKALLNAFFRRAYQPDRFSSSSESELTDESGQQSPRRLPRPTLEDTKLKPETFSFYKRMFIQIKNWKGEGR